MSVEDEVLVIGDGAEILTTLLPRNPEELEQLSLQNDGRVTPHIDREVQYV